MNLINSKILGTPYLVDKEEKTKFYKLLSYSLLSQGAIVLKKPQLKINNRVIEFGPNLHSFGIKLMKLNAETVSIKDGMNHYTIKSVDLWILFQTYIERLYGYAQAEALSKSKEMPKKGDSTREFIVSSGDKE